MNANTIQAMLAINASRITQIEADIDDQKYQAKYDILNGNNAYADFEYAAIARDRIKLKKAVALQMTMKADLASIYREGRIARKINMVKDCVDLKGIHLLTSYEKEDALDKLIVMFVPGKADSRIKPQAKAA